MSDTSNPFAKALGYFSPFDSSDPRVNQQLRQRIALAMMARERKFPKNLGEGLSAIGEAIGDRRLMRSLEEGDLAQQDQAKAVVGGLTGAVPAAAAATPGYAPPDDAAASSPAVAAINSAASNTPPIVPAQAPGRGFTPVPMSAGQGEMIEPGEYNAIDAADPRNRYTPAPAYLQPALERNIQDPERRAYLGQLAGKEAQSAGEVSSTGAAGPFQFTRGTGAQYGIPGNARLDPDASTVAANAFTDDNAKALTARLGREPTPGEMALAHQQGAGTAGNMLTGAGNASASNLAVNNVPPGMGPQAAAQKVMGYYGMPGAGVTGPGNSRDAVATTLMAQAQPQGRPSVADYGQRLALAATPQPDAGIQPAPPATPPIRPAPQPQQQVAQAQPQAIPGYVPPPPGASQGPPIVKMDPELVRLRALAATPGVQNNGYAQALLKAKLDPLEAEHAIKQNAANEMYKAQIARDTEQFKLNLTGRMDQPKRIADVEHVQAQTRKENIVENPEEKYIMGPDGVVRPIKVEGEDPNAMPSGKLTEDQRKTLVYHGWAKSGNQAITGNDQLLAHGWAQEALGKVPFASAAQDAEFRRAKNGADNFILAFMRSTSGAQYGATERLDHAKAMLPKLGDDAKTLADKAAQRQQFVDTEYAGLGKQGQKMADHLAKSSDPGSEQRQQQLIDIEMQGVKPAHIGEVKTNKKTGQTRVWDGSHWRNE